MLVTLQEREAAAHRREQLERCRQFLEDQQNLDELLKVEAPAAVLHEPKVIIGDWERFFVGDGSRIDSFVKIEIGLGMHIGKFVHVASFAHLGIGGGMTIIEDYAAVASGARIISGSNSPFAITMSACAPKSMQHVEKTLTTLKKYATVLTNAVVLPGVTLFEGATLAAGGVATKDIPEWEIWGGVPARFMAKRVLR